MTPRENRLLAALPEVEYARLADHLEFILMPLQEVLAEPNVAHDHVYFPATSMVSLLSVSGGGATTELAVTGREGLVGVSVFMGGQGSNIQSLVQGGGYGYRIPAAAAMEVFRGNSQFQTLVLRFIQALTTQMSQTAVCNRHHSLEEQISRWFLMCIDRMQTHQLKMTQGLISSMLGVRRESVSEIAGSLQDKGYIKYSRGNITILDRAMLEEHACECYRVVEDEYQRLLVSQEPVV